MTDSDFRSALKQLADAVDGWEMEPAADDPLAIAMDHAREVLFPRLARLMQEPTVFELGELPLPDADQAEGPSVDDVAELCQEFGFHLDSDDSLSLSILRDMIAAAITRWRAPVTEPVATPAPQKPDADRVLKLAAFIREVDLKPDANTFVLGENELAEAILAHPGFSGCHDGPAASAVNLAELHDPDFSDGLTPSQHLDALHGGTDPRVAAASAPQPLERLSMGKLVSERIQELLDEVAQRGLEPNGIILGIRAEELLRKEVRKSLLFQRNANQDNPLPLPNVQDQLFVYGVQVNKSDAEAAEYVGIEC
jgi:hypothetical protein